MGCTRPYRVRIKGPFAPFPLDEDGLCANYDELVGAWVQQMEEVREEEWELTDEQAGCFVHEDGYAYAMTVFTQGKPEVYLTQKEIWQDPTRFSHVLDDPELSPERKAAKIQGLIMGSRASPKGEATAYDRASASEPEPPKQGGAATLEHGEMVRQHYAGKLLIGIPRPEARRFFTQLSVERIAGVIGEYPFIEWLTVRSSWVLLHLAIPASLVLAALAFRWFALLVVPLTIALFFIWWAASSTGFKRLRWPLLLLIAAAGNFSLLSSIGGLYLSLWVLVSAAAVFLMTFTYNSAGYFLRCLVLRNERAYRFCTQQGLCLLRRAE